MLMLSASSRLSRQMRLTSPLGWTATQGRNWSVASVSSVTFTGGVHVTPPSRDCDIRTSAFVHAGGPPGKLMQDPWEKSTQATLRVPSVATPAAGLLFAKIPTKGSVQKPGSAFFTRKNAGLG